MTIYCDWQLPKPMESWFRTNIRYFASRLSSPEKGEARVGCMKDHGAFIDKESIGLPAVYTITTLTNTKMHKCLITDQDFIREQSKEWYCRPASSTVELQGQHLNTTGNGLLVRTASLTGKSKTFFLRLYEHTCYISRSTQHWRDDTPVWETLYDWMGRK